MIAFARLWALRAFQCGLHSALLGAAFCSARGAVGLPTASPQVPATAPRPNILFILADDLGYGDLGCYGQTRIKTPNLDRMAAEGIRFTSCYAGSTVCAPSRCSLMTGLHTGHARIRGNSDQPLEPGDVTVAEVLKKAGYKTGLIGKWGLGLEHSTGAPNAKGFDEFVGFLDQTHAHQYYPTSIWRNDIVWLLDRNTNHLKGEYVHDLFTKAALNFIRIYRDQPFFLYLAYTIPHAHNELKDQGMEVPTDAPYSNAPWPQMEKNKAAMITRMDRDIGLILEALRRYKTETNTIVFFSSDNGPHKEGGVNPEFFGSAGPWRGIKRDLYEGGIRVPMIVRWPGRIAPGTVSGFPWAFWDFLPTAAALAGVAAPAGLDGHSVLPVLLGQPMEPHRFFYWEFHERGTKQAVRMGEWKAVRPALEAPLELFNLNTDPRETTNVASLNPEIVRQIEAYLKGARTESPQWPLRPSRRPASASAGGERP